MNAVLERMEMLPPEIRAIIESDEIISIIDEICDGFDIPKSWRSELVRATIRVLSGLMSPVEFVPFIMDEYFMEREDALSVALLINERIFSAVKPQLASLHNIEDAKLAHKIRVPHKPIYEEISEAFESPSETYMASPITYTPSTMHMETQTPYIPQPISKVPENINKVIEAVQPVYTTPSIIHTPPATQTEIPTPYVSQNAIKSQEPILETKTETAPKTKESDTAPLSSTALVNKLNNMRIDPYREKY